MDLKVSNKSDRIIPDDNGNPEVLVKGCYDVYPKFNQFNPYLIEDVEILDNVDAEVVDRAFFATTLTKGTDPLDRDSGISWEQALVGEITPQALMLELEVAVAGEGMGVQITFDTVKSGGKSFMQYNIGLTEAY